MQAEFDTMAAWTAEVAVDLGPDHYLPAGCRGSGSPGALRWLLQHLDLRSTDLMLDCGAGVGGPAGFATAEVGVRPVLTEPEAGACRAARRLFDLPVVQAASELPFADANFDVVWCLGVLCTVADQPALVGELRRVLRPAGRLGMLVFVAEQPLSESPVGNDFPSPTRLAELLADAGLTITESASADDFAGLPPHWAERSDAVQAELERRHGDHPDFQTAARQASLIGRLLQAGELVGTLVVARPR